MTTMLCRDRFGLFKVDTYKLLTCSMCYAYLFPNSSELHVDWAGTPFRLTAMNGSKFAPGTLYAPDIQNVSIRSLICSTLEDIECSNWIMCCQDAINCCERQIAIAKLSGNANSSSPGVTPKSANCPMTWDGYACWDSASPGTQLSQSCPAFIDQSDSTESASKDCTINGTWWKHPIQGHGWTNYTACVAGRLDTFRTVLFIGIAFHILSVLLLLPAIGIFLSFRQLYSQQRIKIHLNLFASFVLTGLVLLVWDIVVHLDRLEKSTEQTLMHKNTAGCKVLYFLTRYSTSTNFYWMFCEGFYLHRLLVNAFEPPKKLWGVYIFGWGVSAIPVLIYSIIRAVLADESCWIIHAGVYEWIVYLPNLLCIVVNTFFLGNILRILLTQIQSHPNEPSNYRRALKATFILVPLFGIQLFLIIYRPPATSAIYLPYEIIAAILKNSQGGAIALVFCFFNGEVKLHLISEGVSPLTQSPDTSDAKPYPSTLRVPVHTHLRNAYRRWRYSDERREMRQTCTVDTQMTTESSRYSIASRRMTRSDSQTTPSYIALSTVPDDPANGYLSTKSAEVSRA
ncbi:calcitonin gene-related peptide type 1 receptor-like isoform X2 [Liolophura sinensis]|uniref:calcitonin gene-related peptide type 1 receptor-like isoform X2 n=1 Tax=Liolophura sinensis TaxID=3198878 RepID=UPI0031583FB9